MMSRLQPLTKSWAIFAVDRQQMARHKGLVTAKREILNHDELDTGLEMRLQFLTVSKTP
jgi:hypothetical protein